MSAQTPNDKQVEPDVEKFLREMDWCAPPPELDRRVKELARAKRASVWRAHAIRSTACSI